MSIENNFMPNILMDEAGGDGGGAGGGAAAGGEGDGGEATNVTPDGAGGTASMLSEPKGDEGGSGGEGDSGAVDLKSILGEEMAGDKNFEKFANSENPMQDIAKSYLEAQKQMGAPKFDVPDADASDEVKAEFHAKMGVPEEAAGYEFAKPEGIPDDQYNEEHAAKWAEKFRENNIPKDAANALRNEFMEEMIATSTAESEAATAALTEAMDKTFGENTGTVTKEIGDLMTQAIPDEALRKQIQDSLGDKDTPAFALALGLTMKHMKETYGMSDKTTGGNDGENSGGKTITEMRADAQKMMASDAYVNQMHKDHATVKSDVNQLYKDIGVLTDQQKKG